MSNAAEAERLLKRAEFVANAGEPAAAHVYAYIASIYAQLHNTAVMTNAVSR
jgi:hypothetical protein